MFKCKVCGEKMITTVVDKAGGIAWICCPEYLTGNDEHDSYQVELTEKIYEEFFAGLGGHSREPKIPAKIKKKEGEYAKKEIC